MRSAELAIIISYPINASGIIVLLKTPTKPRRFLSTLFVKTNDFQLLFNFEQTRTITIFGEHGIMALVIFLDFHSTKQELPLVDSWSRGLD